MAKKIRRQVNINGEKKWISGNTEQEYAENIAREWNKVPEISCEEHKHEFRTYAQKWFEVFSKPNVEVVTTITYQQQLNKHIYPVLAGMNMEDILPADVQRVLNSIEGARESKCKVKNILNMIFEQAMDDHLIQRNPMCSRSIRITGRASKPTEPYSVAQMRFLIQNIARVQKPLDKAYIALHALHPMRLEEVLGLKWKDLHFDTMTLHIERAVTHPHRNQPIVKQPKTEASRRTIDLVPQIVRYLQVGAPEDFVLGGQNPLSYTQVRRMCERIQRDTGFEESITPRRFRTTVLTDLYDTTKDIQQARIAAGHTTAAMTLKHYVKGRREHADTAHPIAVVYGLATDANADWQET